MAERIPVYASDDDFVFTKGTHPSKMLEGLNRLRLNNTLCDVILCCGGQEFPCHRNVLASFSSYFEAMFTIEWMETRQLRVAINGVEPQELEMLVGYAYSSKVVISAGNVQALLTAASLLDVMAVQEACWHYMEHHMDETNCVGIHCIAEAHSCKKLEQRSMEYILTHFSVVCRQEEFLSLSVEKVTQILASDDLDVPKEEMVVEAALLWLNKCPTHRHSFEKVLEQIRLPLISPCNLHDVIESLDVVKESQGCQRLISEAKDQDLLPYSHRAGPRRCTVCEVMLVVHEWNNSCYVESFDPQINRWKSLARLPLTVSRPSLVVSGSSLYLAGGIFPDGSASTEMWRYDLSCDSWLKMASMNEARCEFSLVMLDGYMFALGGCTGRIGEKSSFVERYDPNTNTWHPMRSFGTPVYYRSAWSVNPAVIELDGLIYLFDGCYRDHSRVHKYDPETSVWTECAPMQVPRIDSAVCTLKGKLYVIGGRYSKERRDETNKVECYNPETNQWSTCAPMKKPRDRPGVAVVDGHIYILAGLERNGQCVFTIEQYHDETDTWEIVGEMPTTLHKHFIHFSHFSHFSCFSLRMTDVYAQTPRPSST